VRLPCYYRPGREVVVTHGFIKKTEGPAPKQEGQRAWRIRREYDAKRNKPRRSMDK
jgi:hypothetical protein